MSASKLPKSQRPNPQLSEFLTGEEAQQATGGLISEEDFNARRAKFSTNRLDGSEELLKEKGFKDVKIRFNKIISVNEGPWHDYNWYLEHKFTEASEKEERIKTREKADLEKEGGSDAGGRRGDKRKKKGSAQEESSESSSESDEQASGSKRKKSKEWPSLHSKPKEQRPSSGKKSKRQ